MDGLSGQAKESSRMLILTRKVDQGIIISGNILVRVLGVERDRVKIGISAPGEIPCCGRSCGTKATPSVRLSGRTSRRRTASDTRDHVR
jgi:hypothetical protein